MSNIHIVRGNVKIGNTANISLPPIQSCPNSYLCQHKCYAVKFYKMWPEVRNAWDENLKAVTLDRDLYFSKIRRYLLKNTPNYFRWHVSGDIIDQDYLDRMKEIAKDYFFVYFVVFTKCYHLNFDNIPLNLSVILSIWPGLPIPKTKLPLAFIDMPGEDRAFNYIRCKDDCESCRACWDLNGKNVLLKEH